MNRDELEAVIRRALTRYTAADTRALNKVTDTILTAADEYGLATWGITAERRAVLDQALSRRRTPREAS